MIKYEIFPGRKYVVTTFTGNVTLADVLAYRKRLLADKRYRSDYPRLIDLRALSTYLNHDDIKKLAAEVMQSPGKEGERRAFVTDVDVVYGMNRMLETLAQDAPEVLRTFRTIEEAEQWLFAED